MVPWVLNLEEEVVIAHQEIILLFRGLTSVTGRGIDVTEG